MDTGANTDPAPAPEVINGVRDEARPAVVAGKVFTKIPEDLYIPPDALLVFLESFEGPLDLLLYLIRRRNFDILALPVAEITEQYMQYVERMKELQLQLAADYLVMAAMLAEIKSRMLLPRPPSDDDEEDPRAELVRRLLEYQRFKNAAEKIGVLPRLERELTRVTVPSPGVTPEKAWPHVGIEDIVAALQDVLNRVEFNRSHHVMREPLSVRERISTILSLTAAREFIELGDCFTAAEGRSGVVVTLLALLELMRSHAVEVVQVSLFGPLSIRKAHPPPERAMASGDAGAGRAR